MVKRLFIPAVFIFVSACGSDSGGNTGPSAVPASVTVSPPSVTLDAISATVQFSATVKDQNGQTINGASVVWASSNSSVLSIDGSTGMATAVATGDVSVTATSGTASGSASAKVRQIPTRVEISVTAHQLSPGSKVQASFAAFDAKDHPIPQPEVAWASGSPGVASVSDLGEVTGVSPGLAFVKGSMGPLADSVLVSVSEALQGDQLSTETGPNGEAAVFTALGGGTHLQLSVEDGFGQPLVGAVVQFAEVGEKALLEVKGPGNGYAPAILYGPIEDFLALGTPLPGPEPEGSTRMSGMTGPERSVPQAALLALTLPAVSSASLTVLSDALLIPTFHYDPEPVDLGTVGPFLGRACLTWDEFAQHQKDRLALIPGWTDAVVTLERSLLPTFFDPAPLEGEAHVFFPTLGVVPGLTGEKLLAEKINLLGAMQGGGEASRRIEVSWEFGDGGPALRGALGWYGIKTNDPYCGGAVPQTLTSLPPALSGEPGSMHQASVRVESVWGSPIPGTQVAFSIAAADQGSLGEGGLEAIRTTNENGLATVFWTLPASEGQYVLSASVPREGGQPLTTTIAGEAKIPVVDPTPESLAMGPNHTCAVTPQDGAYCWGQNQWGELGLGVRGSDEFRKVPDEVANSRALGFRTLTAGVSFTCGLDSEGRPHCWGRNELGQLGSGFFTDVRVSPTPVEGGFRFVQLVSGWNHTCGLTEGGLAYCWGGNERGQLGDGTQTNRLQPRPVTGGLTFSSLAAGGSHTCGISSGGDAYCWGANDFGALGDGTTDMRLSPVGVSAVADYVLLAAGEAHTCALSAGGQAYCWGSNNFGQLGNGTKVPTSTPTPVAGSLLFSSVHTTASHTCGLAGGISYCWGRNHLGQVGSTSLTDITAPHEVRNQQSFRVLQAGPYHSCALTATGKAYCWGTNSGWQLGQGESVILFSNQPLEVNTDLRFGTLPSS